MKFYGYKKCGTCRKAQKYLDSHNVEYKEIDITLKPPPKSILKKAMAQYGMKKMFNTSGQQYKTMNIKDKIKTMSESNALDLMATNGRLIKRPLAIDGNTITVGFDPEVYANTWVGK